jgi:hypothetical protein
MIIIDNIDYIKGYSERKGEINDESNDEKIKKIKNWDYKCFGNGTYFVRVWSSKT